MAEKILGVQEAYKQVLLGNPDALNQLSQYANGGDNTARKLIHQIKEKAITFRQEDLPKLKGRSNLVEVLVHPIRAFRTKIRQLEVKCDMVAAPAGSNQGEFSELPPEKAAELIVQVNGGGVQFEDWSQADQERLRNHQKPRGVPTHWRL